MYRYYLPVGPEQITLSRVKSSDTRFRGRRRRANSAKCSPHRGGLRVAGILVVTIVSLSACLSAPAHRAELPDPDRARLHAVTFEDDPVEDPERVRLAEAGEITEANAAWWGFDSEDATEYLQAAIDSGVEVLRVPDMGSPWTIDRIWLESDQEVVFEDGVEVVAIRGGFHGGRRALFTARNVSNVTLRGYGATFRMWKQDYQSAPYEAAEWRHTIDLRGVSNFEILGLTLLSSGGDGIYVGRGTDDGPTYSSDVTIRDVIADDHHRQGISVISVQNLLIENSRFTNTRGTWPQSGIDFEPNRADERIVNAVIRNSYFGGNAAVGVLIQLMNLEADSIPVDITIEETTIRRNPLALSIIGRHHDAPGSVTLRNNRIRGIRWIRPGNNLDVVYE